MTLVKYKMRMSQKQVHTNDNSSTFCTLFGHLIDEHFLCVKICKFPCAHFTYGNHVSHHVTQTINIQANDTTIDFCPKIAFHHAMAPLAYSFPMSLYGFCSSASHLVASHFRVFSLMLVPKQLELIVQVVKCHHSIYDVIPWL